MKTKIPHIEELMDRYVQSLGVRYPNLPIGENAKNRLIESWKGQEKKLYGIVKNLESEELAYNKEQRKIDKRVITFQTGVDILGFPTFTTHVVQFENNFRDPKRFKKQGSDSWQKFIKAFQFNHIHEGFKSRILPI